MQLNDRKWNGLFVLLGFAVFGAIVFRAVWPGDQVLFTTDDNIGVLAVWKSVLPGAFLGYWDDSVLVGVPTLINVTWTRVLLWLLPLKAFSDWIHALDLVIGSFFFVLWLRERNVSTPAAVLGALTAFWLGSTFTLTYAGHIGKFGTVMFAGLYLWCVERAATRCSPAYGMLAGGAMGGMLLEQADLGLFFAIPFGLYAVYALVREHGWKPLRLGVVLLSLVAVAGLISLRPAWTAMQLYGSSTTTGEEADPQVNWEYCTQWSWPPAETIDFIAPGFTGWRSQEPSGPYWGKMGRSAEWEETQQGFRNFRLEAFYLGAIPLMSAAWLLVLLIGGAGGAPRARMEAWFWVGVTAITFLLALGKFFPLYRAFYHLPGMSSIRNPVKFMQVFQVGLGVLTAMGLDAMLKRRVRAADEGHRHRLVGGFAIGMVVVAAVLLLGAGVVSVWSESFARTFTNGGWGNLAPNIVATMKGALLHGGGVSLLAAAVFAFTQWFRPGAEERTRWITAWVAVALVAGDQLILSNHYVQPQDMSSIERNGVVDVLKPQMNVQRAALASRDSFYNYFLSYVFPYHGIDTVDVPQIRMPEDYQRFLSAMSRYPFRLWQLCGASFLLGPGNLWSQVQRDAGLKDAFELIFAYNVAPDGKGGIQVIPASASQPGQHCVLRFKGAAPRYALVGAWEVAEDDQVLASLASAAFSPLSKLWIAPEGGAQLDVDRSEQQVQASVQVERYRPGRVQLKVSSDSPALLRSTDRYDRHWKAYVNGEATPVVRCDFLFQAIPVPEGLNEVLLVYDPPIGALWIQFLGMALGLGAVVVVACGKPAWLMGMPS